MFCSKCGNKIELTDKFCKGCGLLNNEYQESASQRAETNAASTVQVNTSDVNMNPASSVNEETAASAETKWAANSQVPQRNIQPYHNAASGSGGASAKTVFEKGFGFIQTKDILHNLLGLAGSAFLLLGIFFSFFTVSVTVFAYSEKVSVSFWGFGGWSVFFLTLLGVFMMLVRYSRVALLPLIISTVVYLVKTIQCLSNTGSVDTSEFLGMAGVSGTLSIGFFMMLIGFILCYVGIFLKKSPSIDLTKVTSKIEEVTVDRFKGGLRK